MILKRHSFERSRKSIVSNGRIRKDKKQEKVFVIDFMFVLGHKGDLLSLVLTEKLGKMDRKARKLVCFSHQKLYISTLFRQNMEELKLVWGLISRKF